MHKSLWKSKEPLLVFTANVKKSTIFTQEVMKSKIRDVDLRKN